MKLLLVLAAAHALLAAETVTVQGKVVNSIGQEAIPKVMVVLRSQDVERGISYATMSKGAGSFTVPNVVPGAYVVTAQRDGFTPAEGEPPVRITVEIGKYTPLVVKMVAQCVIAGRVLDEDGDPVRSAPVQALRYLYVNGRRQLSVSSSQVTTDDRGDYRLFGLAAGKFYIRVAKVQREMPATKAPLAYMPTFYPNTNDPAAATEVKVAAGGEARGIDITLRKERVYTVRGTAADLSRDFKGNIGQGVAYEFRLVPRAGEASNLDLRAYTMLHDDTGSFEFANVPLGSYLLTGTHREGTHRSYTRQLVDVAADVSGLTVAFAPGQDVTGKVILETPDGHDLQNMQIRLTPATPNEPPPTNAVVNPDGTFVVHDVSPDQFEISLVTAATKGYLKSLHMREHAVSGRTIDATQVISKLTLILATDFGDVEGTVKGPGGGQVTGMLVTAIPDGGNLGLMEFFRFAFTDEKGTYRIRNLPPGDYKLFAWDKVQVGASQDPDFRKPYEKQGTHIKVGSNGHEKLDLAFVHVTNP